MDLIVAGTTLFHFFPTLGVWKTFLEPQQQAAAFTSSEPMAESLHAWKCPACTFENPSSFLACSICGTQRPLSAHTASTPPLSEPDSTPATSTRWSCSTCTYKNHPSLTSCSMCQTPKPRSENKEEADKTNTNTATTSGQVDGSGSSERKSSSVQAEEKQANLSEGQSRGRGNKWKRNRRVVGTLQSRCFQKSLVNPEDDPLRILRFSRLGYFCVPTLGVYDDDYRFFHPNLILEMPSDNTHLIPMSSRLSQYLTAGRQLICAVVLNYSDNENNNNNTMTMITGYTKADSGKSTAKQLTERDCKTDRGTREAANSDTATVDDAAAATTTADMKAATTTSAAYGGRRVKLAYPTEWARYMHSNKNREEDLTINIEFSYVRDEKDSKTDNDYDAEGGRESDSDVEMRPPPDLLRGINSNNRTDGEQDGGGESKAAQWHQRLNEFRGWNRERILRAMEIRLRFHEYDEEFKHDFNFRHRTRERKWTEAKLMEVLVPTIAVVIMARERKGGNHQEAAPTAAEIAAAEGANNRMNVEEDHEYYDNNYNDNDDGDEEEDRRAMEIINREANPHLYRNDEDHGNSSGIPTGNAAQNYINDHHPNPPHHPHPRRTDDDATIHNSTSAQAATAASASVAPSRFSGETQFFVVIHQKVDEKSGRDEEGAAMEMGSIRLNVVPHLWAFSDCTFGEEDNEDAEIDIGIFNAHGLAFPEGSEENVDHLLPEVLRRVGITIHEQHFSPNNCAVFLDPSAPFASFFLLCVQGTEEYLHFTSSPLPEMCLGGWMKSCTQQHISSSSRSCQEQRICCLYYVEFWGLDYCCARFLGGGAAFSTATGPGR
eukprot:jgi/Bigna1/75369/fgenesh1_pg.34_\